MTAKKALWAITILLSSQAVFCMDYHELYQDTGFFENVRTQQQNPNDPFYLESSNPIPTVQQQSLADTLFFYPLLYKSNSMDSKKSSDSSDSDSDKQSCVGLQLKPRKKRKATTAQQEAKRIKIGYTVTCPECGITMSKSGKATLARIFLAHKYSKAHNEEKFAGAREHINRNKKLENKKWHITCMHENCKHTLSHNSPHALAGMLMHHLYVSNSHVNNAEIEEVLKYIEEQGKK